MYVVSNDFIPVHKMDTTNNTMYREVCCMNMYIVVYIGLLLIILLTLCILYIVLLAHKSEFN